MMMKIFKKRNNKRGTMTSMKKNVLIFILSIIFSSVSFADYQMRIANVQEISPTSYRFDIFINSTSNSTIVTSYQCALKIPSEIINSGTLSFSYEDGSTQLNSKPSVGIGIINYSDIQRITFGSLPVSDTISSEVKVGSFIVTNTAAFANGLTKIDWIFDGNVNTIITGEGFENITDSVNHISYSGLTSSNDESNNLPGDFLLGQNYPNPFNPTTTINFSLKEAGKVNLVVYNLIGEKVADLVNNQMEAGNHNINFNASHLPSGVYVYRLDVESKFTAIKKMILMK